MLGLGLGLGLGLAQEVGILYTLGIPMRDPRTMRLHRGSTPPTR